MYRKYQKISVIFLNAIFLNLCLVPTTFAQCEPSATKTADGKFEISGVSAQQITAFSGTTTGIDVNLGSGAISSGDISFTLDTSQTNLIIYNFDSGYATFNINLLIDLPLLTSLGEPPASINLIESAFLPAFNIIEPPEPATSTDFNFLSDIIITQPLLSPQVSSSMGTGTIGIPTGEFKTLEFVDSSTLNFFGGGTIQSGILSGFSPLWPSNPRNWSRSRFSVSVEAFDPLAFGITNPTPLPPINNPPPGFPEPPIFPDFPTLPKAVEICSTSVNEPSFPLGLLGIGILATTLIYTTKLNLIKEAWH